MAREDRALRESSETEKKTERVRDIHGLSLSLSLSLSCWRSLFYCFFTGGFYFIFALSICVERRT